MNAAISSSIPSSLRSSFPAFPASPGSSFEVRYASLFTPGRALVFPCDAGGNVDIDALSDKARLNYFFARAMVGKDYSMPRVCHPEPTLM